MRVPVNLRVNLVLEVEQVDGETMPSTFAIQEAVQTQVMQALNGLADNSVLSEAIEEHLDNQVTVYQDYTEVKLMENQP